jgi:murein tripeptide amidase MpaA
MVHNLVMSRSLVVSVAILGVLTVTPRAQTGSSLAKLKTKAEASDFKSTSTYRDVVAFMKVVEAEAHGLVHYTSYGTTSEGREMPMAVVGLNLKDASPATVKASGKLRVHIQGNIHAGEVEGKEAAQILLRELGLGQHAEWLQNEVLLITPIFNADGNERFDMNNRARQNGPINGEGTRANGQNLNINRDFMKLDTPEGRAFAKLWNDYDPQVGFDLHTSDGSNHGYYLTYSPPLNPDTSDLIMSIMKNEWFPFVTKNIKAKHGWDTFYYGNVQGGPGGGGRRAGAPGAAGAAAAPPTPPPPPPATPTTPALRAWQTFEHVPRFHNNYVGMRNRFALLSEAYAYATFEDRIKATNYFLEEALTFASQNAVRLKKAVVDADNEKIPGMTLATRARIKTGDTVTILMGEVEDEKNPNTGSMMNRRKDVVKPEQMTDKMWFEPSSVEVAPTEYYIPATATRALDLLRAQGVAMRQLSSAVKGVEQFSITSNTQRPANGGIDTGAHGLRTLEGKWDAADAATTAPKGAWAVSLKQPLARLAFYLIEPTSDDGLTAWNFLDDMLGAEAKVYPILRKR